jgi:hypothetical protein
MRQEKKQSCKRPVNLSNFSDFLNSHSGPRPCTVGTRSLEYAPHEPATASHGQPRSATVSHRLAAVGVEEMGGRHVAGTNGGVGLERNADLAELQQSGPTGSAVRRRPGTAASDGGICSPRIRLRILPHRRRGTRSVGEELSPDGPRVTCCGPGWDSADVVRRRRRK